MIKKPKVYTLRTEYNKKLQKGGRDEETDT